MHISLHYNLYPTPSPFCSLHLPFPLPMQVCWPPTINTPNLPSSPPLSHWDHYFRISPTFHLLSQMTFLHFTIRMSSRSAALLFLLLLAGPSNTSAPRPSRAMAGLEGHVRTDAKARSGLKEKVGDRTSTAGSSETGLGNTRISKPGVAAPESGEGWGEFGTTTNFRSTLSTSDDGLWEPRSSSRCVPIPSGMALCQNIGYDTMRMPNLLGHESPAEAVQQSASWLPLLARECHPDARIFLCSLFAPICLDR